MSDENAFKFTHQDFGSFKKNYSSFLKNYTSSLSEMVKMNNQFLEDKTKEIDKLMKINNVIFSQPDGSDAEGDEGGPGASQVNAFMKMSSQTSEQVNEQFKHADAMLKNATKQLEELTQKSNEMLKKMHPEFQANPAPEAPAPSDDPAPES
ncbi:hypothetical protein [Desulfoluna butyratoxydans]|uniref:Phasin n=1 Tax=Desulfoluna butyratoxydans TaxID=231438 RepID=A0A4U8YU23_9BACT|nr:hypothetical protein [Desulfoluna butyratoxydans]VFQ45382.1 hypothetical protein MSL71_30390 [Desulfoluna butyratoxydans]